VCYSAPADCWFTFGVASSASLTTTASEAQYKAELQQLEQLDEENYFPFGASLGHFVVRQAIEDECVRLSSSSRVFCVSGTRGGAVGGNRMKALTPSPLWTTWIL
jgi:hypothetical protein